MKIIIIIIIMKQRVKCASHGMIAGSLKRGSLDGFFTKTEALLKKIKLIHEQPQQHKHDDMLLQTTTTTTTT